MLVHSAMEKKFFRSNEVEQLQWRRLLELNMEAFIFERTGKEPSGNLLSMATSTLNISSEYFNSSGKASISVNPLLLYYGTTNLLTFCIIMFTGSIPNIAGHGIEFVEDSSREDIVSLGEFIVRTQRPDVGALGNFHNVLCNKTPYFSGVDWYISEIIAYIPELFYEFNLLFPHMLSGVIPVSVDEHNGHEVHRILRNHMLALHRVEELDNICGYKSTYLEPQLTKDWIIFRQKLGASSQFIYSTFDEPFIQMEKQKNGRMIALHPLEAYVMLLYSLSFLCRYKPHIWYERVLQVPSVAHLVSQIVEYSRICIPHMVLSLLGEKPFHLSQS
jgi:hypothetical protein